MDRLIGRYTGKEHGPLLICIGGMHGNEPAGVEALSLMFKMLDVEPITNPDFDFKGRIVGIIGHLEAFKKGKRFINKDLNRQLKPEIVGRVLNSNGTLLEPEEIQIKELILFVRAEIEDYKPSKVIVLDLHTTSSYGGIFTIATDDEESTNIAIELHAPVIKGMLKGIEGTSLHYFNTENMGVSTTAVCFESGQHYDRLSINRAIAAITNCMRTIGCVNSDHVENRHDALLIEYSKNLPKVARLIGRHGVLPEDDFKMLPEYNNFQKVEKGEILATDKRGIIKATEDSLILMPLYQKQGEDGFFLVKQLQY
jgi:succinylglutamate desuccinylase